MFGDEAVQPLLHGVRQRFIRGTHVGKLRLAAIARNHPCREQRIARRNRLERAVRVPEPIAQTVHPPPIVQPKQAVLLVEIRDVGDVQIEPRLMIRPIGLDRRFQGSQQPAEGDLVLVRDRLIVENQHGVPIGRRDDFRGRRRIH